LARADRAAGCIGNLEHDLEKWVSVFRKIMLQQNHWDDEKTSRPGIRSAIPPQPFAEILPSRRGTVAGVDG
jgi:hypothetical protein